MALNFTQSGYDLEIDTTTSEIPPQFTRGGLVSVQLTDDTFDGLDKMVLLFAPDDGRRHAPAVVELSKTDGMHYAGAFTRASMLHDGPVLVVLAGTTNTQTITSNAYRITVGKSLDPESGMLADPATLADVVAEAVDAWLKSDANIQDATSTAVNAYLDAHGAQTGATAEQAAQIQQNKQDIANLAATMGGGASVPDYVYAEADAVSDRLVSLQNENTFNFALFTDLHYAPNLHESNPTNYPVDYDTVAGNIVSAINQVNETVPLACVVSLGDNIESVNQNEISAAGLSTPAERGQLNRSLQLKKSGALAKRECESFSVNSLP